jgi:hypothetical protein
MSGCCTPFLFFSPLLPILSSCFTFVTQPSSKPFPVPVPALPHIVAVGSLHAQLLNAWPRFAPPRRRQGSHRSCRHPCRFLFPFPFPWYQYLTPDRPHHRPRRHGSRSRYSLSERIVGESAHILPSRLARRSVRGRATPP